jgi:hypothetical protein
MFSSLLLEIRKDSWQTPPGFLFRRFRRVKRILAKTKLVRDHGVLMELVPSPSVRPREVISRIGATVR